MPNATHDTHDTHEIIIVAFELDVPRIAFWKPECAAHYAMRRHRTDKRMVLQFFMIDLLPWEDTLVTESVQGIWYFEGLASSHEVEYARLIIPLV